MPRRAARKDDNHNAITALARAVGAEVLDTHQIPGLLDCLVAYRGRLMLWEIKDGAKPPSDRRLTEAEEATIARLRRVGAPVYVVETTEQALKILEAA